MNYFSKQFIFTKQFIFVAVGVALLVAGGIFIFATNDQGEPPIAYWKFDEGSASTTVDSYNSLSNGTLTGGVQWVNGVYGTGLQFDGINDYVSGSDEIFPAGGSARTVSMWVKTGELPVAGSDPVFLKYGSSDFGLLFSLAWEITAGANQYKIMFTQMGSTAYSNSTLSPNTWYYITLTYPEDGIDSTFYINGKLDGSFSLGSNTELIGYTIGEGFSGIIDDVKIYNYVRTAGQVKNDYNKGKALYIGTRITDCDKSPADCVNKGLVGYWNMDEMGSTTAFDKSGNNNNGSLGAGVAAARPVWASGIQPFSGGRPGGGALSFDGVNDTVNCGNPSALYLNQAGGFTISAWVKSSSISTIQSIVTKGSSATGAGSYDYDFLIVSSKLYVKSSDGTNQIVNFAGTQTLQSNTWYYVNYVWDGTTNTNAVRVYVNGVIDKTGTATGANATITTSHTLYISGSSYEMNGLIDGVRIYNRALSATEISYQYNQSKPIAQWKFDEGSGNYAYDSSGNANTGSLSLGGSATSSAWVSGVYGGAMNFDGVDDYVSMGEPAILNLTGPFALSAWLYPTPPHLQGYGGIYGNRSGNGERILLLDDGSLLAQYTIGGAGKSVTTAVGSVPSNKWSFVSLIYDGSEIAFWINGVKQTPVGATGAVYNSAGTRQIGWGNNTVGYYNFKGKMDDVRIYQYARTAEQVKQDYNDGKAVYVGTRITDCDKSPADCVNSGLVGYWGMDEMGSTTVKDLSGNNNNGLLGGGTAAAWPFWTQGVQPFSGGRPGGGALKFDGVDDYVDIGDPSSGILDFGTGSFSVSLWVKAPTTGGNANQYGGIFKGCGDGNIQSGWLIRLYNYGSSISFYGGNGTSNVFDVATTRSNNVWTNVVGVLDRSAGKAYIYRDGVLASTDTTITNGDISSTRSLTIARDYSATKNLQGIIDEVKIYNRALSDAEIRYQYNQGKPIAWYKMDEGADTATTCNATRSTVYDSSPSAYNLDLHLGTATTTVWADGKYSCGLQFNGTNDYASSSNSVSMATGTLSFWAKPNTTTQKLLQLTAGNYVQLISGVASTTGFGTPTIYIDGKQTTTFPDTNWHHITVVSTASITANATYLGRVGTSYYNGLLDDVRIYNYGLTADQVRNVYNAGALYSGQ